MEKLAAFRRIGGQPERLADLLRGPFLRAAVDQPERAVDAVRGDERVFLRVLPADQLEERWQIAVAMAVCETIEEGRLLFYNPSMPKDMNFSSS